MIVEKIYRGKKLASVSVSFDDGSRKSLRIGDGFSEERNEHLVEKWIQDAKEEYESKPQIQIERDLSVELDFWEKQLIKAIGRDHVFYLADCLHKIIEIRNFKIKKDHCE